MVGGKSAKARKLSLSPRLKALVEPVRINDTCRQTNLPELCREQLNWLRIWIQSVAESPTCARLVPWVAALYSLLTGFSPSSLSFASAHLLWVVVF